MNNDTTGKFELYSLLEIFDRGKRAFKIPDYQRGYSWESQQVNDLIKDLEHASAFIDMRHFAGTLVATKSDSGKENEYDLVDGQQRLTTLIILLSILYKEKKVLVWKDGNSNEFDLNRTFIMDGSIAGNTRRLFTLNRETDKFFLENILKINGAQIPEHNKSHSNLLNTKSILEEWLKPKNMVESQQVLGALINNFGFLFYAPDNTQETGMMFEVINNRGKRLSHLDKVKNYLLYYAAKGPFNDLSGKVNAEWGNNLLCLNSAGISSNESEDAFLRNCYLVFFNPTKKDSYAVYDRLKEEFPADAPKNTKDNHVTKLIEFVDFIGKATLSYRKLYTQMDVVDSDEKDSLLKLSLQSSIASVIPLILAVLAKEANLIKRVNLLVLIEKLNFRYYGCHIASRADSGQGELFDFAHHYYSNFGNTLDNSLIDSDWLESQLIDFVRTNASDISFIKALTLDKDESGDYYHWQSLKYFLANYEEKLKATLQQTGELRKMLVKTQNSKLNDSYDKEHIWATKELSHVKDSEQHINKRRLGNFALLEPGPNIVASNLTIEEKIASNFTKDTMPIPNNEMIRELKELYDDAVQEIENNKGRKNRTWRYWDDLFTVFFDKREAKMLNFALNRWRVYDRSGSVEKVAIDSRSDNNHIFKPVSNKGTL